MGRLKDVFPHLHVPNDILQHDNGIIHNEAHRERQRQEGKVIYGVAHKIHNREGAHNRHGQRQTWNYRGREVSQKEKDHQNNQAQGDEECNLYVPDRLTYRLGAVVGNVQAHRCRKECPELGEERLDGVYDFNCIRARLPLDGKEDHPSIVVPARHLVVFHAIDHLAQVLKEDRGPIAVGHNEWPVGLCIHEFANCLQCKHLSRSIQGPCGHIHVLLLYGVGDLINSDGSRREGLRIESGPNSKLLGAHHVHLGHPADHGDARSNE